MRRRVLAASSLPGVPTSSVPQLAASPMQLGIRTAASSATSTAADGAHDTVSGESNTAGAPVGQHSLNKSFSASPFHLSTRSSTTSRNAPFNTTIRAGSLDPLRTLATMAHNTNQACCSIPPVQSDYSPKGTTEKIGGLDAYVIGPKDAKKAIVVVYDIFGYWPTTKQGADLMAEATKARIVMPDFFRGKPFPQEYYPPNTDEKKNALQAFFGAAGDFQARKPDLDAVADALKQDGATKLGLMGFCWGGKFSVLGGGEGTKFSAVAQIHPAMVSADDAAKLTVPVANFPSKDEPKEDVDKFEAEVQKKSFAKDCVYKLYPDSHHGWAAARADLKDEGNLKNFQDVYQRLADFFNKTLA